MKSTEPTGLESVENTAAVPAQQLWLPKELPAIIIQKHELAGFMRAGMITNGFHF